MNINRNNYESFFLLYIDRELNQADMQSVDHFLNANPDLQNEFSLLKKTVFSSSEMIFENKELLFRKEEKKRVIPMYWLRMAAAIAVLLLGSWIVISQLTKNTASDIAPKDQVANVNTEKKDNAVVSKMEKEKPVAVSDQATANGTGDIKTGGTHPVQNNAADIQTNSKSAAFNRQPEKNDLHEKNSSPVNAVLKGDNVKSATALAAVQTKKDGATLTASSEANASGTVQSAKSNATVPAANSDPQSLIAKSDRTASEAASGGAAIATVSGVSESGAQSASALATKSGLRESGTQSNAALAAKSGVAASGAQSAAAKSGSTESGGQSAKVQSALVAATAAVSGEAEYAVLNDQENQNAISVVALNEKNKAITGFFKKFTKRAPADERKKIRVSVFQFSL